MTVPRFNATGRFDPAQLFRPASVAVLGVDSDAGAQIMANLAFGDFKGELATRVSPGLALGILALPPDLIGGAMLRLAENNCFAAIIPGPCDDLAALSARTGVRALGPHSFGVAVPRLGLNATRAHMPPPPGRLALISQSSALSRSVIDWAEPNGVGFSHIVGLGANAGIGFSLTLDWLSRDAGTGAILLDIRRIKNHRQFLSAARAAARLRPVVALGAGLRMLDDDGAGDLTFQAALRRAGVLCVSRLEDLLAAAETLSRARPAQRGPGGETLAIVSNAIGPARLAADSVLREGLALPPTGLVHVPTVDLAATAFRLAASGCFGGVLVVHAPTGAQDAATIASLCQPTAALRAPVLVCAMGETSGALHRATLGRAGLPVFATPDQAVRGFGHLVQDRRNRDAARELPASKVLKLAPDKAWVRRIFAVVRRQSGGLATPITLTQDQALDVLAAYGIPVVPTHRAASPADAGVAADLLGYPSVLKLRSVTAPADRRFGGIAFDLRDASGVQAAAELLCAHAPSPQIDAEAADAPVRAEPHQATPVLLVQRQAGRGRELSIRVSDDATFGPAIMFGSGGSAPHPADRAVDLPPLNLSLAHGLIQRSRAGAMLGKPLRDRLPADIASVAEVLVRVSQLIIDFPEIAELQIPSLFADPAGVLAADAWLRLRVPDQAALGPAIAPYPAELIEHRQVGGDRMTIRPIRPEDANAHTAFFARLSPADIRFRFFSAMRKLSAEQTARMTQVDYDREMAFIAVDDATSDTVGVARLVCEAGGESGEFAVIVQASMKGRGLGSHLMRRLIAWARMQGLQQVVGQILADNAPMLGFIRHIGFSVHRMADDPEVMEARLLLPAIAEPASKV